MAIIRIKRSSTKANFGTNLLPGELGYSYISKQLYIGSPVVGEPALAVGGSTSAVAAIADVEINLTIE